MLRPEAAPSLPRVRPAAQPIPSRAPRGEPLASRKPVWDKDNFGFWLTVCIVISLAFSIVWRAIG